jgi:hypothetical protein
MRVATEHSCKPRENLDAPIICSRFGSAASFGNDDWSNVTPSLDFDPRAFANPA